MLNHRNRENSNGLSSASLHKKKLPNKVGLLVDLAKVKQYCMLNTAALSSRLHLKPEREYQGRCQAKIEVAIQTDQPPQPEIGNPMEQDDPKRGCLTDQNDYSSMEQSGTETEQSKHRKVRSKYSRSNWQALAAKDRSSQHEPVIVVTRPELRKPPAEFKKIFLQDEGELSLITGTVLAQRKSSNQQQVAVKPLQEQKPQQVQQAAKRNRIFPKPESRLAQSKGYYSCSSNQHKENVQVRQWVSPIKIKRTDRSMVAAQTMEQPMQLARSIHSQYLAQQVSSQAGGYSSKYSSRSDNFIGGFDVTNTPVPLACCGSSSTNPYK